MKSRYVVIFFGILLIVAIGLIDYLTGPAVSVSIFYLVPIILGCLYVSNSVGILLSLLSVVVSLKADLQSIAFRGDFATAYWNAAVRLAVYLVVTYILAMQRKAEEKVQVYAHLHEIDRAILAKQSSKEIGIAGLTGLNEMLSFQSGSIVLMNHQEQIRLLASIGMNEITFEVTLEGFGIPDLESFQKGKIVQRKFGMTRSGSNSYFPGDSKCVFAPMHFQEELLGFLILARDNSSFFTAQELDIISEVVKPLSLAIMNANLFEQLRESHHSLHVLSQRLLEVQERERHHLARELHDELGQALTAVKINLQAMAERFEPAQAVSRVQETIHIVEKILHQVRSLTLDLRPLMLDDLGLVAALRWYVSRQSELGGFTVHFESEPENIRASSDIETTCFRVAQEALTNIVRHARARRVNLQLNQEENHLKLVIQDDGAGFDVSEVSKKAVKGAGMGLFGMRERVLLAGGTIEIESAPSFGTAIRVNLPNEYFELKRL